MAAPSHLPSLQATPATKDRAGSALAPSSCFSPAEENLFSRKGAPQCLCADKGGNVNTLPAPASQLSEVANASRANSSYSASCINCGGLDLQGHVHLLLSHSPPFSFTPHTCLPPSPLPDTSLAPWELPRPPHTVTPSLQEDEGWWWSPPALAASASCSDRFCQMKYLCHATLPAVKEPFSLISAFLTNFGSWRTAMLR